MVDSRAGRVLDEQDRRMLDDAEFDWVEAAMRRAVDDGVQHVVLGTSLPWLLPHAIHEIERWNETLNVRHEGRLRGRLAEKLRQAADLEHWAAFGNSFERLGRAVTSLARGRGRPGAGDGARALRRRPPRLRRRADRARRPDLPGAPADRLAAAQPAPHPIKVGLPDRLEPLGPPVDDRPGEGWPASQPSPLDWTKAAGPFFGNQVGELVLDGPQRPVPAARRRRAHPGDRGAGAGAGPAR